MTTAETIVLCTCSHEMYFHISGRTKKIPVCISCQKQSGGRHALHEFNPIKIRPERYPEGWVNFPE